ncbi:Uncharacterised protein at_DN1031 [Pycnogonum litorale]
MQKKTTSKNAAEDEDSKTNIDTETETEQREIHSNGNNKTEINITLEDFSDNHTIVCIENVGTDQQEKRKSLNQIDDSATETDDGLEQKNEDQFDEQMTAVNTKQIEIRDVEGNQNSQLQLSNKKDDEEEERFRQKIQSSSHRKKSLLVHTVSIMLDAADSDAETDSTDNGKDTRTNSLTDNLGSVIHNDDTVLMLLKHADRRRYELQKLLEEHAEICFQILEAEAKS